MNWWDREDVRTVLRSFYNMLSPDTRLIIVGRRYGELRFPTRNLDYVLDVFKPIRYIGYSLQGWSKEEDVLHKDPLSIEICFDLDNFPYAFDDMLTLTKWAREYGLGCVAYFTGSRGIRVSFGKATVTSSGAVRSIGALAAILRLRTVDLAPYLTSNGWIQPAGTLHRKSGLPLFSFDEEDVKSYEDLFRIASEILKGSRNMIKPEIDKLNGDKLVEMVNEALDKLSESQLTKVRQLIDRYVARAMTKYHFRVRYVSSRYHESETYW